MRIWTSRYGNQEAIIKSTAVPVRITVGRPKFRLRYKLAKEIHLFKPAGALFQMNDKEELRKALYAKLDQVGIEEVRRILHEISSRHGDRDVVLPCFEDVKKPGEWCHRQLVADWLNEHGLEVRELGIPARLTNLQDFLEIANQSIDAGLSGRYILNSSCHPDCSPRSGVAP